MLISSRLVSVHRHARFPDLLPPGIWIPASSFIRQPFTLTPLFDATFDDFWLYSTRSTLFGLFDTRHLLVMILMFDHRHRLRSSSQLSGDDLGFKTSGEEQQGDWTPTPNRRAPNGRDSQARWQRGGWFEEVPGVVWRRPSRGPRGEYLLVCLPRTAFFRLEDACGWASGETNVRHRRGSVPRRLR